MKCQRILALASAAGSLILCSDARASYIGLVTSGSPVNVGGTLRNVFRVYALFSDPNDYLTSVFGSPELGNMVILSRNNSLSGPGSPFFNHIAGGLTAPSASALRIILRQPLTRLRPSASASRIRRPAGPMRRPLRLASALPLATGLALASARTPQRGSPPAPWNRAVPATSAMAIPCFVF